MRNLLSQKTYVEFLEWKLSHTMIDLEDLEKEIRIYNTVVTPLSGHPLSGHFSVIGALFEKFSRILASDWLTDL